MKDAGRKMQKRVSNKKCGESPRAGLRPSFFILFLLIRSRLALDFFLAGDGQTILLAQPGVQIVRPAMLAAKGQRASAAGIEFLAALGAPRQRHPRLPAW
jgi:hypothetical protein